MARLRLFTLICAVALAVPANAQVDRWAAQISEAARRFHIPESWIRRVMEAESGGHPFLGGLPIASRAGAMGLMQLMPVTWSEMRETQRLGGDPFDPHDNIIAGAAYLRAMYDRFGYPGLFAAYNVGPARFARHLATGAVLPLETIAYLRKTAPAGLQEAKQSKSRILTATTSADLFVRAMDTTSRRPTALSLFVIRR